MAPGENPESSSASPEKLAAQAAAIAEQLHGYEHDTEHLEAFMQELAESDDRYDQEILEAYASIADPENLTEEEENLVYNIETQLNDFEPQTSTSANQEGSELFDQDGNLDIDQDGIPDYRDTTPPTQLDRNGDGLWDMYQPEISGDEDGDGIADPVDRFSNAPLKEPTGDADGNGVPDMIQSPDNWDADGNGVPDMIQSPDNWDADGNGVPDSIQALPDIDDLEENDDFDLRSALPNLDDLNTELKDLAPGEEFRWDQVNDLGKAGVNIIAIKNENGSLELSLLGLDTANTNIEHSLDDADLEAYKALQDQVAEHFSSGATVEDTQDLGGRRISIRMTKEEADTYLNQSNETDSSGDAAEAAESLEGFDLSDNIAWTPDHTFTISGMNRTELQRSRIQNFVGPDAIGEGKIDNPLDHQINKGGAIYLWNPDLGTWTQNGVEDIDQRLKVINGTTAKLEAKTAPEPTKDAPTDAPAQAEPVNEEVRYNEVRHDMESLQSKLSEIRALVDEEYPRFNRLKGMADNNKDDRRRFEKEYPKFLASLSVINEKNTALLKEFDAGNTLIGDAEILAFDIFVIDKDAAQTQIDEMNAFKESRDALDAAAKDTPPEPVEAQEPPAEEPPAAEAGDEDAADDPTEKPEELSNVQEYQNRMNEKWKLVHAQLVEYLAAKHPNYKLNEPENRGIGANKGLNKVLTLSYDGPNKDIADNLRQRKVTLSFGPGYNKQAEYDTHDLAIRGVREDNYKSGEFPGQGLGNMAIRTALTDLVNEFEGRLETAVARDQRRKKRKGETPAEEEAPAPEAAEKGAPEKHADIALLGSGFDNMPVTADAINHMYENGLYMYQNTIRKAPGSLADHTPVRGMESSDPVVYTLPDGATGLYFDYKNGDLIVHPQGEPDNFTVIE